MPKVMENNNSSPKPSVSPIGVQHFGLRRSSRSSAKSYVPGQNDITAIQKKERYSTNKARKANVYMIKRKKQLKELRKAERKRQVEEDAFLEKELTDTNIKWTEERKEKLSKKMQELIELTKKTRPDSETFWYAEEISHMLKMHGIETFSYFGVSHAFLTELANFVISSIKYETHYKKGHTTWEYRKSVVDAVNEFQNYFGDKEDCSYEMDRLHSILEGCGINVEEEFDVDDLDMDSLVEIRDYATRSVK